MNTSHLCCGVLAVVLVGCEEPSKAKVSASVSLPEVSNQTSLVRLTSARIPVSSFVSARCRVHDIRIDGPHEMEEAHLFASAQVLAYAKQNPDGANFPIGSVFTKEKYHADDLTPHLATTMTRTGSKGDISDWQFGMYALPSHLPVDFDQASCAYCHQQRYAENGFVSDETRKALREYLAAH